MREGSTASVLAPSWQTYFCRATGYSIHQRKRNQFLPQSPCAVNMFSKYSDDEGMVNDCGDMFSIIFSSIALKQHYERSNVHCIHSTGFDLRICGYSGYSSQTLPLYCQEIKSKSRV